MYCTYNIEEGSTDDANIHTTEDQFKVKLTQIHTIFWSGNKIVIVERNSTKCIRPPERCCVSFSQNKQT
jgi:hypothetical protein